MCPCTTSWVHRKTFPNDVDAMNASVLWPDYLPNLRHFWILYFNYPYKIILLLMFWYKFTEVTGGFVCGFTLQSVVFNGKMKAFCILNLYETLNRHQIFPSFGGISSAVEWQGSFLRREKYTKLYVSNLYSFFSFSFFVVVFVPVYLYIFFIVICEFLSKLIFENLMASEN